MMVGRMTLSTLLLAVACARGAQVAELPPAPATAQPTPAVGAIAPDFRFTAITKDGFQKPVRLSEYKGQTVVIWFFFKARTRG